MIYLLGNYFPFLIYLFSLYYVIHSIIKIEGGFQSWCSSEYNLAFLCFCFNIKKVVLPLFTITSEISFTMIGK